MGAAATAGGRGLRWGGSRGAGSRRGSGSYCGTRAHLRHPERWDRHLLGVTASQAGNQDYLAATSVSLSFTVTPLKLALSVSPTTATTGQTVTASFTLGNHTSTSKIVSGTVTLTYTGNSNSISIPVPFTVALAPGQTLSKSVTFPIQSRLPRGTYTVTLKATDGDGTAISSASLTVT